MAKIEDVTFSKPRQKSQFIISPTWILFQVWEGCVAITCLLVTVFVTFQLSFKEDTPRLSVVIYVSDVLYLLHIVAKFHLGYISHGALVTDRKLIKEKYLKLQFPIDLLSTFVLPLEIICAALSISHTTDFRRVIRIMALFRIMRFYSLTSYFGKYEDQLGFSTKSIRSFKYLLVAYALIHCLSCGWYVLACPNEASVGNNEFQCYAEGWAIVKEQGMEELSTLQRYIKCLYWATITATSTGYGDIHAVNSVEKWYSVLTMLVGIGFFFGPILGYMASTLTNAESKRAQYTHRIAVINDHLRDKSVSNEIQTKVKGYYEYLWTHHQGTVKDDIFSELPITFKAEISLVMTKHILEKAPLFRNVCVECLRMVSLVIQPISYLPMQIIFSKNDIRHCLFYIKRGSVEVLADDDSNKPVKILKEGSFFGEVSLLLNVPRCATVRAATHCEVMVLERSDLTRILKHFPDVSKQLYDVIERRCDEAARHIENRGKENTAPHGKRFTIDKAVITLSDFVEENDSKNFDCSSCKGNILFHPKDRFLTTWTSLVTLLAVFLCFFQTYIASFTTCFGRSGFGDYRLQFGLLYLIDAIFLMDMFVQARTVTIDENSAVVEDLGVLWRKYAKSWRMVLDVAAIFPLEMFALVANNSHDVWILVTFLRFNRLLKAYKIFVFLTSLESNINFNIAKIHALKLSFMISFITHLCGCVWFLQACFGQDCGPDSWVTKAGLTNETETITIYVMSLYWAAATMTSTGYGDITANTSKGEFIVLFVLITGLLLYGYCLSNIAATLTNKLSAKVEFTGRIIAVTSFMSEQNLQHALIERVERYLGLVWRIHRGEAIPGAELLMGDLPLKLQEDVSYEEMHKIISKVPIFMNTDATFLRQLSAKLITYVFMPGDVIVYKGDVGREMYIMRRGLVEVLSKDRSYIVATLGPGGYFGEVGLIFGEPRTADVRAKTYCELAMLRKSDLDEVLVNFPLIERQLHMTSTNKTVLHKIQAAAKKAGAPRKAQRIDLIDKTRRIRSKSIFRKPSLASELTEEEANINQELNGEFNAPYLALHPVLRALSYLLMRNTVDPHGIAFRGWTSVSVGLSCIYFVTLGLQVAFLQENYVLMILNYLFDLFFLVDIYIKMHVCFYNKDGVLVTHPTATALNYLKSSFILDFLAFFPIDLFFIANLETAWPAYYYAKINRVLHLIRVAQYFQYLDTPIRGSSIYRGVKFGIYMFLLTHLFACLWFMSGCSYGQIDHHLNTTANPLLHNVTVHGHEHDVSKVPKEPSGAIHYGICDPDSWAMQNGRDLALDPFIEKYVTCLYWAAATTCSVGYGDIHAYLTEEMALALICMIVGVVFYGYIIASAAASLANADVQRARYQQKLDTIGRFLKEQKITQSLKKRVEGFYEFLWNRNKGVDLENLFQGLPISLQADITLSLYKDIIESVPLFQGTELGFTKMLSLYIQPLLVPKGEYIVRKGDIGEEMFFINKGVVEVVSEHENPIIFDTMSPGRFFGEISTIFKCPRTASIRTQTNVEMFVLKKKDLDVVLSHYPQIKKQIIETAEERQRLVKERAAAFAKKKKEEEEAAKRKKEEEDANRAAGISADDANDKENEGGDGKKNENGGEAANTSAESEVCVDDAEIVVIPSLGARMRECVREKWLKFVEKTHFVIDTNSRLHWVTNGNCFLIFLTYITITYMATYQHHPTFLVVLNLLAELCFIFEIYLKFHMAYLTNSGDKVTDLKEIRKHYFSGKFKFDVLANFPLGIFCFVSSTQRMRYYSYLNLIHMLRIHRLRNWFQTWLKKLNINVLLIRLGENLIQIILTLQTFACIWYFIACPGDECRKNTWVENRHDSGNVYSPEENYVDSVYWALATMTSTGYGDIHATNTLEKVFATIVMVFGKLLFGFVLGNVASTMANVEALRVKFEERFSAVQAHMRDQKLPLDVQDRVVKFFQYIWRRNRGSSNDAIFSDLPPCLNAELCLELTGDFIQRVPLLSDCELPFIRLLSTKTELIQFHQDEFITRKGDIGNEMYFIKKGKVEVLKDGLIVSVLQDGDYFGDESLLGNAPRKHCVRAVTHVDMFCLRNVDLKHAFLSFPEEEERVRNKIL